MAEYEILMIPIKIERRSAAILALTYENEPEYQIDSTVLRRNCPCALCREERGDGAAHARPLTSTSAAATSPGGQRKSLMLKVIEHTVDESTRIEQLWSIGNYALGVRFGDGHDDGIYSWPYLRILALNGSCAPTAS